MKYTIPLIGLLICAIFFVFRMSYGIEFNQHCGGFLRQASNASTVETALEQLNKATSYLERKELTHGYTSIFIQTPNDDIGFWYDNLKAAENELSKVDDTISPLERTNILMKLRETLTEDGKDGNDITYPRGLQLYPNNGIWMAASWFFAAIGLVSLLALSVAFEK